MHKDETVFLSEPTFSLPERKGNKGRVPTNIQPIQLQNYVKTFKDKDYTTESLRQTAIGLKLSKVHILSVLHWDGKEEKACKKTLFITISE